jgi:predicted lipoprotein with Yx(FWY)xxD motif
VKTKIALAIAVAATVAAALIPASLAGPSKDDSATVVVRSTNLGRILADGRGHTLYVFEKDKRGRSACYGACAAYWPPLLSSAKPRAARGARGSLLGLTKRADGKLQVTYAGHPLYAFIGDTRAGQTLGEGLRSFGAAWDALAASGRAVEPAASDSGGGTGYGGYGGYGSGR